MFFLKVLSIVLCLLSASVGKSEAVILTIDRGQVLELKEPVKSEYLNYLETRRRGLVDTIKDIKFPGEFGTALDVLKLLDTRSPEYPNRNYHCRFLNRIRNSINSESERHTFDDIFRSGKVCIASDLNELEQDAWGKRVANFFWHASWLKTKESSLSLSELVRQSLGSVIEVDITNWNFRWDATYGNLSEKDSKFVQANPVLKSVFAKLNPIDINDILVPESIGADVALYAKERPVYFPDVFSAKSAMYMSASIGPADMPEVLLHEYGHIYFDMHRSNFSALGTDFTYAKPAQHDEACAELLPSIMLRPYYSEFPELEIVHVVKLLGLGSVKPADPHFVGSGAVFRQLQEIREKEGFYKQLVKANDFQQFVLSSGGTDLQKTDEFKRQILKIQFD